MSLVEFANALLGIDFPNGRLIELPEHVRRIISLTMDPEDIEDVIMMALFRAYEMGRDEPEPEPLSEEFRESITQKCLLQFKRADFADSIKKLIASHHVMVRMADRGSYSTIVLMCKHCERIRTSYPARGLEQSAMDFILGPFLLEHHACVAG